MSTGTTTTTGTIDAERALNQGSAIRDLADFEAYNRYRVECDPIRRDAGERGLWRSHCGQREDWSSLCPQLPVMEFLHTELGGIDDSVRGFMGLQHLFGSTASLIERIVNGRIDPHDVFLLGKPYSTNQQVMRFLQWSRGYWVHPESIQQPIDRDNDGEMDRRIETVLRNVRRRLLSRYDGGEERVLLIDDGGRAIRLLHSERFADIRHRFTCVEQTRCGIRTLADIDLEVPVVNVAESWVKLEHESPLIAESVNHELTKQLAVMAAAGILTGKRALIIGYGAIGRAVSVELSRRGFDVCVYDKQAERRDVASRDGFPVYDDLYASLHRGGVIIGCTGLPVLDHADYGHIPDGAILISASSADVEFRSWQLRAVGDCLGRPQDWRMTRDGLELGAPSRDDSRHNHPCFSLFHVQNGDRHFYLVNGGFPVNFTGGIDPIPPEKIQLTRCLLYLGALQASSTTDPGLHALNDWNQHLLMAAFVSPNCRQAA